MEEGLIAGLLVCVCLVAMFFAFRHEQEAARGAADTVAEICAPSERVDDCLAKMRGK